MGLNVLITGSSSGFGKMTVLTLLAKGHKVTATMREPEGRNKKHASELREKGATVLEIDVTDDESVTTGVQKAIASTGKVDVLINNAGIGVVGWQEAFTIENFKALFDLNVFGVQRMNRAILPHMKETGGGSIVYISSLLGRFALPFFGPYNATKHAVEALADNYRVELSQFGIETLVVQPGGFGTDFTTRLMPASDRERAQSYGPGANAPEEMMAGFDKNYASDTAPNPQMVPDAIARLLELPRGQRPIRTVVDGMGMGDAIQAINDVAEQSTRGIYTSFGMENLFQLKA